MRHPKIAGAALCMGLLVAAGCSSNKPSKADLTSAVDNYYSANPECLFSSPVQLPAKVDNSNQQQMNQYNALTQAGLLTKTGAPAPEKAQARPARRSRHAARHAAKAPATPPSTTFALSDNGRFSWTADETQPGFGNFCYGHRHVTSIDSMATSKHNGAQTAVASYHYDLTGVPSWAKSSEVQSAFPNVQKALAGPMPDKGNFVKDSTGWKFEPSTTPGNEGSQTQGTAPGSQNQ